MGPGNRHKLSGRKVTKCCPKYPPTKEAGGFGILGLCLALERCQWPLSISLRMRLGCCAGRGGGPRHGDGASWGSGQPRAPWRKVMLWHLPLTGSPPGMARLGLSSHSAPVTGGLCSPGGDRFYLPGSVWLVRACVSMEATRIPPSAESDVLDVGHQLPPSGSFSELNSLTEGVLILFTF